MADVYADMFLADQWLKDNPSMRTKADTTYFYDAVFKKHGYTRKDYDASVRHYLEDPQDYAKILKKTSQRLQKKRRQVEKKLQELKAVQDRINSITIPEEGMWQKLSSCRDSLVRGISNNEE
ncbi:MAG: DUF4296 domain-containing protein [Bacteroidales bacterium]|nr:DUF4296 domain-containing protein [Bacteroidales bacterium]